MNADSIKAISLIAMTDKPKSRKPTYGAAMNIARILQELYEAQRPPSITDIVERLGISKKTIQRYLKVLNSELSSKNGDDFISISRQNGKEELFLTDKNQGLSAGVFQLASMVIGLKLMDLLSGTVLKEGLEDLKDKLKEGLSSRERKWLIDLDRKFMDTGFGKKNYKEKDDQLDVILQGLLRQLKLEIEYEKGEGESKTYIIRPYTFLIHKGAVLYLLAHVDEYNEVRTFRIEKIKNAVYLKEQAFQYPPKYQPKKIIQGGFGVFAGDPKNQENAVIEFDQGLFEYISTRNWHPSQQFSKPLRGKFRMTVTLDDFKEFKSWAKSFIPEARVVKPSGTCQ